MPWLQWLTRDEDIRKAKVAPYRLLEPALELSAGDSHSPNMLIQGDNLEALKALLPYYAGRVKCIYIDPPYNTRSAFEHYDDSLEHSLWLAMMYPRLELLRELLSEDGSIWVSIDDNEAHYLKIIMDEILGRQNFVANIVWQKVFAKKNKALISGSHDYITVYAKKIDRWQRNLITRTNEQLKSFKNPDNDPRGPWQSVAYSVQSEDAERRTAYRYAIEIPSGRSVLPPTGRHWNGLPVRTEDLRKDNRIWFGQDGDNPPRLKVFLSEVQQGIVPDTWWPHDEVGDNQDSKKEMLALFPDTEPFGTPKPENLLSRILTVASNPEDIVLDSFLGSGTTAAVAHKMGRRYIGIELGNHAATHCAPRLKKVIDGEQGGISETVNWKGGGGFRFYRLGEAVFDDEGRINPKVKFAALAAHVWFTETGRPLEGTPKKPFLGSHDGIAYGLLYNGVLGDKSVNGGNVFTSVLLERLKREAKGHAGPWVIYGEATRLSAERLRALRVTFKQTPYDIRAR
jgi:adenine-specific DNA-methyltransferase